MSPVVRPISKRAGKKPEYAVKPVNPSPGITGSVLGNSLNAAIAEGEVP